RMIDTLLQPQLPWRSLLARHMALRARDDFTYARPGRREGEAILPSLGNAAIDVTVALDTSGSISKEEIDQFVSEIDALKGQVRARVNLLACDACLAPGSPWVFEPWEPLSLPETLSGGGGTDFLPVFDWAKGCNNAPDLLVYFTDGQGRFPGEPPAFPVIWLVKGRADVPWGERIQLN
ncbi:MAG: VWA-like domain-containing protein, partial [Arenicellales bacterium]|nr:VWA-like domain-containing protein [Arenicellales bacterium]